MLLPHDRLMGASGYALFRTHHRAALGTNDICEMSARRAFLLYLQPTPRDRQRLPLFTLAYPICIELRNSRKVKCCSLLWVYQCGVVSKSHIRCRTSNLSTSQQEGTTQSPESDYSSRSRFQECDSVQQHSRSCDAALNTFGTAAGKKINPDTMSRTRPRSRKS